MSKTKSTDKSKTTPNPDAPSSGWRRMQQKAEADLRNAREKVSKLEFAVGQFKELADRGQPFPE